MWYLYGLRRVEVPVTCDEVAPDKCYRTVGGQIWSVLGIDREVRALYQSKTGLHGPVLFETVSTIKIFAAAVDEEVNCYYAPAPDW